MNPKIAQHQQRNAQTRLRQRYAFLNIGDIQSTDGDIAQRFVNSGIYRIDRPAAARFPFHQNGEIDRAFRQAQHQAARAETVRRILALHADTAWICSARGICTNISKTASKPASASART